MEIHNHSLDTGGCGNKQKAPSDCVGAVRRNRAWSLVFGTGRAAERSHRSRNGHFLRGAARDEGHLRSRRSDASARCSMTGRRLRSWTGLSPIAMGSRFPRTRPDHVNFMGEMWKSMPRRPAKSWTSSSRSAPMRSGAGSSRDGVILAGRRRHHARHRRWLPRSSAAEFATMRVPTTLVGTIDVGVGIGSDGVEFRVGKESSLGFRSMHRSGASTTCSFLADRSPSPRVRGICGNGQASRSSATAVSSKAARIQYRQISSDSRFQTVARRAADESTYRAQLSTQQLQPNLFEHDLQRRSTSDTPSARRSSFSERSRTSPSRRGGGIDMALGDREWGAAVARMRYHGTRTYRSRLYQAARSAGLLTRCARAPTSQPSLCDARLHRGRQPQLRRAAPTVGAGILLQDVDGQRYRPCGAPWSPNSNSASTGA